MLAPMLSKLTDRLPSGKDYIYEIKLDGQRTIAEVKKKDLLLYTRNFQNVTGKYPELNVLHASLSGVPSILDGEIVALENGIPSFELLQRRMSLRDLRSVRLAVEEVPIVYYVFDILQVEGKSLLQTPLLERKKILTQTLKPNDLIKVLPFFESREFTMEKANEFGYEGVVAKNIHSPYVPGQRTDLWLKYKFQQTDSFVIGGWMEGGRSFSFGSLIIGQYRGKKLIHCGRVGTGFDEAKLKMLMSKFSVITTDRSPFEDEPSIRERIHWLKPRLVIEVKFKEWTKAGILRSPVFIGLREDIKPQDAKAQKL